MEIARIKADRRQIAGLWCIFILVAAFILSNMKAPVLGYLGIGGVSLLLLLLMMLIQVDKKPLINLQELSGKFSWGMYLLMVFLLPLAAFMGAPQAGISASVKTLIEPALLAVPAYGFIVIALIFTTLLTNFLNNMPVAVIIISIMGAIQSSLSSLNFAAACLAIAVCAFISMATPMANSAAVYIYSDKEMASLPGILKIGIIVSFALCLLSIAAYYPFLAYVLE